MEGIGGGEGRLKYIMLGSCRLDFVLYDPLEQSIRTGFYQLPQNFPCTNYLHLIYPAIFSYQLITIVIILEQK